jgi:hypothetical protein
VAVAPGTRASVGVIKLRKATYYRVHVTLRDECGPSANWILAAIDAADMIAYAPPVPFTCEKELLIRNVKPGSHIFAFSNEQYGSAVRWALVPVQVTRANVEIKVAMAPPSDIRGRILTVEDAPLPPLASLQIRAMPALPLPEEYQVSSVVPGGLFGLLNLPWQGQRLQIEGLSAKYYVKEIRAGGTVVTGAIPLIPGAPQQVEIVVDNQAAGLTGTVMDADKPVSQAVITLNSRFGATADNDGNFQVGGLAPGEYSVVALPASAPRTAAPPDPAALRVKLGGGESKSVSLKLAAESR